MQISIAQLAALALAASSAVHGHHLAGNTGVVRRVAGHALMAFAVPALAAPVDAGLDIIVCIPPPPIFQFGTLIADLSCVL